ncbi:Putative 2-selenouridine synthase [gamma proteobacterium HdN1]|nr:Putative 2-selenouridine synthase [gamma proteobacterium HdN1]
MYELNELPELTDYSSLFLNDVPMMDVRAPIEFKQGSFPMATNVPLLDNAQREQIGIRYKQAGQDAAIDLGLALATSEVRAQRICGWKSYIEKYPQGALFCFRGGLRSRTTQRWLAEQGIIYPRIKGGYKAMRRFLIETLEHACQHQSLICISGRTGSGKTDVLLQLRHYLDLEGRAHHRGSTFGNTVYPQPAQIDFENAVAIDFLKHAHYHSGVSLFIEDESRLIGRIALPPNLQAAIKRAPRVLLEEHEDAREQRVLRDYILVQREQFKRCYGADAAPRFASFVLDNLARIEKRLGSERHDRIRAEWQAGLVEFENSGNAERFVPGIRCLLSEYYDPMYDYQITQRDSPILWQGDAAGLVEWARSL